MTDRRPLSRYAILHHRMPPGSERADHFDLLLEAGNVLRAWALSDAPAAECDIPARSLPDHRMFYLDYEGPISGGRGTVARWDRGTFQWLCDAPDHLRAHLSGQRLDGTICLTRCPGTGDQWTFLYTPRNDNPDATDDAS